MENYKEALERAKIYYDSTDSIYDRELLELVFPELKKSRDEKIRKEIIKYFTNGKEYLSLIPYSRDELIEWLEKLGLTQVHHKTQEFSRKAQEQDEQKPSEEIKPKFKIGDWITNGQCIWKIDSIEDGMYYTNHGGIDVGGDIESIDNEYHLWALTDAKPGDVLHSTTWGHDSVFIFNGLTNWKFEEPDGYRTVATAYCCLDVYSDKMEFGTHGPDCVEVEYIKPATNIQRDLLFQEMKKAGYEWDSNKLELKKVADAKPASFYMRPTPVPKFRIGDIIKHKTGLCPAFKIDRIVDMNYIGIGGESVNIAVQDNWELVEKGPSEQTTEIDIPFGAKDSELLEETIPIPQGCSAFIKEDKVIISKEKRPVSVSFDKEVKKYCKELCIHDSDEIGKIFNIARHFIDWQKSKQKPTQGWTEEDEIHLTNAIIAAKEEWGQESCTADWLRSIKTKIQPKQDWSEGDEEAINEAIVALEDMCDEDNPLTCYAGFSLPFKEAVERLKSIKPHNLMKALQAANKKIGELVEENYYLKEQQHEWTTKDSAMLDDIIDGAEHHRYPDLNQKEWLQNLKKLAIWKPSEDQLMALEYVIQEETSSELIKELYNQLKKL